MILFAGLFLLRNHSEYRRTLAETDRQEANCKAQGSSQAAFLKTLYKDGRYENPLSKLLIAGQKSLREGLSQSQVREILGSPSYVEAYRDKDGAGFNGCEWIYLVDGRPDGGIFQEEDLVSVYFDGFGRLTNSFRKKQE
jgi:hypothetical protein